MNNVMEIDGHKAVIAFDPEIRMFRGEFVGLNGGADFYASSVTDLEAEARRSLKVFLEMCAEEGLEPFRAYSGRFNLRLPPETHAAAALAAAAARKSLNEWVAETIRDATSAAR